jgi:hypothetical protein
MSVIIIIIVTIIIIIKTMKRQESRLHAHNINSINKTRTPKHADQHTVQCMVCGTLNFSNGRLEVSLMQRQLVLSASVGTVALVTQNIQLNKHHPSILHHSQLARPIAVLNPPPAKNHALHYKANSHIPCRSHAVSLQR